MRISESEHKDYSNPIADVRNANFNIYTLEIHGIRLNFYREKINLELEKKIVNVKGDVRTNFYDIDIPTNILTYVISFREKNIIISITKDRR